MPPTRFLTALLLCGAMFHLSHLPARADAPGIQGVTFHTDSPYAIAARNPAVDPSDPDHKYSDGMSRINRRWTFTRPYLWGDRMVYQADDLTAQFYAILAMPTDDIGGYRAELRLLDANGHATAKASPTAGSNQVSFIVTIGDLAAGRYTAEAKLVRIADGTTFSEARYSFQKIDKRDAVADIPADGIPIELEQQDIIADAAWPVRAGVPLPLNAVMPADVEALTLYENGTPIPAAIRPVASWAPNGSVQWVHVDFIGRYSNGKPAEYRLRPGGGARPFEVPLKVEQVLADITIDTGAIRFTVNGEKFAGIEQAALDPTGRGRYRPARVISRMDVGGAYLVDELGTRYEAARDAEVSVTLEDVGPTSATIVARGWYTNPDAPSKRLCKFETRITAYAGLAMLRITQQTYLTFDTREKQLADVGFVLPVDGVAGYRMGVDGEVHDGRLPASPDTVFLHQDRHDRFRIVEEGRNVRQGRRSDGWFTMLGEQGRPDVTVVLRDVWQKFPKEIELNRSAAVVHFWPKHGHEAYTLEEQLDFKNLYKFLCFHQGRLLDLKTPQAYLDRFAEYAATPQSHAEGSHLWWRDSERDGTKSGSAQGVVISNEMAIVFTHPEATQGALSNDPATFARLFDFDPAAHATPQWNTSTSALGNIAMAAADAERFGPMENAVHEGWLSWTRSVERYGDYGLFNYADTHSIALIAEGRPGLHRIWQGSHYRNVGTNWIHWYRTASPKMLRWARANTDQYVNVKMTNYVDLENPIPVMDHELGAMQHMGWKTHWASSGRGEAWGQFRDVIGHFIDPDAPLWCWYLTGNPRAREAYGFWHQTFRTKMSFLMHGYAREFNTTLAYAISCYRATWDPVLIPAMHTAGASLLTVPLEKQQPGPMWHPWWMVRYHDQLRDAKYEPWIFHYARHAIGYPWPMALSAKAYRMSGDVSYLTRLLPRAAAFPRQFYRNEGDLWDWWGGGPGPLGGNYAYMGWGVLLKAFNDAGIESVPPDTRVRGAYPYASERHTHPNLPDSITIYALSRQDEPVTFNFGLHPIGGSLHATSAMAFDPQNKKLFAIDRINENDETNKPRTHAADGQTGLYRIEYRGHEAGVPLPQTNLPLEAAGMRMGKAHKVRAMRTMVLPLEKLPSYDLTIAAASRDSTTSYIIEDANGRTIAEGTLLQARHGGKAQIVLNPLRHPLPWTVDVQGLCTLQFSGDDKQRVLLGSSREALEAVAAALGG